MNDDIRKLKATVKDLYSKLSVIESDSSDNVTTIVNYVRKIQTRVKALEASSSSAEELELVKNKVYDLESLRSKVNENSIISLKVSNMEKELQEHRNILSKVTSLLTSVQDCTDRLLQVENSVRYLLETNLQDPISEDDQKV